MKRKRYIEYNRAVYNELAPEFKEKIKLRSKKDKKIINDFSSFLIKRSRPMILDLGPGNGQMARLMIKKGFVVDAIDISEKMAAVAKETAPQANITVGDFISRSFRGKKYNGILAIAFIHLFPTSKIRFILNKIHGLLKRDGVLFISTTRHRKSEEGFFVKQNFNNKLKRFRKRFTKRELKDFLISSGFQVVHYDENKDENEGRSKMWMSFVVKPI